MFKKFLIIFAFCMSIFGITAFADVRTEELPNNDFNVLSDVSYKDYKYYLAYVSSNGNKITVFFNEFKDSWTVNGIYYTNNQLSTSFEMSIDVNSSYKEYNTDNIKFADFIKKQGKTINSSLTPSPNYPGATVNPPVIAPTVTEAIQQITPGLSAQLKKLLPVGVILLSIMLGVSLVPRLVRLFL